MKGRLAFKLLTAPQIETLVRVKKQTQSLSPLTFSSGASLMQSNLDANFLGGNCDFTQAVLDHLAE